MEKQTNSEMNNNIESNEAQPTKKKRKIKVSTIIIIVLVILLLFSCVVGGGSDTDSPTSASANDIAETGSVEREKKEKKIAAEPESRETDEEEQLVEQPEKDSAHAYVGDYFLYESGLLLGVIDAGIIDVSIGNDVVYVDMELENTLDDSVLEMHFSWFSMYIDDYQVKTSTEYYIPDDEPMVVSIEINPGRKAKFSFRSALPSDYDKADKIEVRLPGSEEKTVLIKDNGIYVNGQLNTPTETSSTTGSGLDESWYDDFIKVDDLSIVMTLCSASFDGPDAEIYVEYDYIYQWLLFMEDERNGYLTYMEGYEPVGTLLFTMDGIVLDCEVPELNGTYWIDFLEEQYE